MMRDPVSKFYAKLLSRHRADSGGYLKLSALQAPCLCTPSWNFGSRTRSSFFLSFLFFSFLFFSFLSFSFLSLDAHNHVDNYSGTLGGVRKVHISALVTSP